MLTVVGRGATYRDAIDDGLYGPRRDIHFEGMQYPARHRPQERSTSRHEVLRRHLRLPGQPGRLVGHRRRPCARAARSAASPDEADLVVVNTCSVTATADQGARQTIRRIARDNPEVQIVVTGCYATRRPDGAARAAERHSRRVQQSTRTTCSRNRLQRSGVSTATRFGDGDGAVRRVARAWRCRAAPRSRCACRQAARNACSYCIIPTTRGEPLAAAERDRASRLERVVAAGYKEIVDDRRAPRLVRSRSRRRRRR